MNRRALHKVAAYIRIRYKRAAAVGLLLVVALGVHALDHRRVISFTQEASWIGLSGKFHQFTFNRKSCPRVCWEFLEKNKVETGECGALPEECSACIFCRRWFDDNACPNSIPKAFNHSACAVATPGRDLKCTEKYMPGGTNKAQLQGAIIDAVFETLCLARQRKVSRGLPAVASMLVFSVGFDSSMWHAMNSNGTTEFVEDAEEWLLVQPEEIRTRTALVKYDTATIEAGAIVCDRERLDSFVKSQLPARLVQHCWDLIFVDGPLGFGYRGGLGLHGYHPGRMQSIWAAAQLAGPRTVILVDDCERQIESEYTLRHLSSPSSKLRVMSNGHGGYTCIIWMALSQS